MLLLKISIVCLFCACVVVVGGGGGGGGGGVSASLRVLTDNLEFSPQCLVIPCYILSVVMQIYPHTTTSKDSFTEERECGGGNELWMVLKQMREMDNCCNGRNRVKLKSVWTGLF